MANPATLPILLKELHLSCLASQWERLQEQALANHWPLAQYLTVLCENEVAHRQSLRLQRYLKESHLPATKTLSQFDFSVCAQINPAQIAHLAQNADWVERADNRVRPQSNVIFMKRRGIYIDRSSPKIDPTGFRSRPRPVSSTQILFNRGEPSVKPF